MTSWQNQPTTSQFNVLLKS